MTKSIRFTIAALAVGALGACASTPKEEKTVEVQVKLEKPTQGTGELAMRGAETFQNAPGLSAEQKEKLMKIHSDVYTETSQIRDELTQTKSLMWKTLVNPAAPQKELKTLKKKVIALDQKRLDLMLKAFDEVKKVVGSNNVDEKIFRPFMEMDHVRF